MPKNSQPERVTVPVSVEDAVSLQVFADRHDDWLDRDVVMIRGEDVLETKEASLKILREIEQTIGGTASSREVNIGLVDLDKSEAQILERARGLKPQGYKAA